jgi:hypothetical protein
VYRLIIQRGCSNSSTKKYPIKGTIIELHNVPVKRSSRKGAMDREGEDMEIGRV